MLWSGKIQNSRFQKFFFCCWYWFEAILIFSASSFLCILLQFYWHLLLAFRRGILSSNCSELKFSISKSLFARGILYLEVKIYLNYSFCIKESWFLFARGQCNTCTTSVHWLVWFTHFCFWQRETFFCTGLNVLWVWISFCRLETSLLQLQRSIST